MYHQITALYYVMALVVFELQSNVWLGHNTNSSISSVVVQEFTKFVDMSALLMIIVDDYSSHLHCM